MLCDAICLEKEGKVKGKEMTRQKKGGMVNHFISMEVMENREKGREERESLLGVGGE